jgi:hypothetical protein
MSAKALLSNWAHAGHGQGTPDGLLMSASSEVVLTTSNFGAHRKKSGPRSLAALSGGTPAPSWRWGSSMFSSP